MLENARTLIEVLNMFSGCLITCWPARCHWYALSRDFFLLLPV